MSSAERLILSNAGKSKAARIAIIAITTRSSINVKPRPQRKDGPLRWEKPSMSSRMDILEVRLFICSSQSSAGWDAATAPAAVFGREAFDPRGRGGVTHTDHQSERMKNRRGQENQERRSGTRFSACRGNGVQFHSSEGWRMDNPICPFKAIRRGCHSGFL